MNEAISKRIMLEKPPDLQDIRIIDGLRDHYGLDVVQITFLPLGADRDTAVYRSVTGNGMPYFVKLRRGAFDDTLVTVPRLLCDQGVKQIIAPLSTRTEALWATLGSFSLAVYPFVEGRDGYEIDLTDCQWVDFGRALKGIHTASFPPALTARIPREVYSPRWREIVRGFQTMVETPSFGDPVAAELAAFLKTRRAVIASLVERAEALAAVLQTRSLPFIVCHADIHAGNLLIDANGHLYVVDWDTLTLAPKERDLMFVGGGLLGGWRAPHEEETLFYQGYGPTPVDPIALAYYRYERIVQDIAAYCEQILLTHGDSKDREQGLQQLTGQFLPNAVIEVAWLSEKNLPPELRSQ